jgi:transposase
MSARIGVSQHSLCKWIKAYAVPAPERLMQTSQTEERDFLKKPLRTLPGSPGKGHIHQAS